MSDKPAIGSIVYESGYKSAQPCEVCLATGRVYCPPEHSEPPPTPFERMMDVMGQSETVEQYHVRVHEPERKQMDEHARLERAVLDAAKKSIGWMSFEYENLKAAVDALIQWEQERGK